MKTSNSLLSGLFIASCLVALCSSCRQTEQRMAVSSSKDLIERVVPEYSRFFEEEYIPEQDDSLDVFEIESRDGKVVLRGNNGVSIASALNYYLEKYCNAEVSWNTEKVKLPEPLPVVGEKIRKTTPYTFRHYFNYCTFNYSASWWDWKRWQKEIDFMALHGINMPLALTGQNIVWYKVYKDLGFSDKDLQEFFTGPDYFIWFWMGNMDGWGGPLSKHFMKFHKRLQKRILARERGLGMTPVLPSFTGHVPPAFPQRFPDAKLGIVQWGEGCNTTPPTYVLNPEEPMFQEIGRRFLREQTRLFGTDHLYSADTFNEMTPPTNDPAYLNSIGRNVYDVMTSVDPEAVWVMQGWMFFDRAWFWQPAQMKALFDAAPQDRLVILDLWCEKYPMWSLTDAFYGEQWIWNMLHNFGGRQSIYGDMETVAKSPAEALHNSASGKMKGIGLTMEAIEQNPAIYSLMLENVWNDTPVNLDSWIREYPVRRYGVENADAARAWQILRSTAYSNQPWYGNVSIIAARPTLEEEGNWVFTQCPYDKGEFLQAADALVAAADELRTSEGYRYDVVNVVRQVLSNYSNDVQRRLAAAYETGDRPAWDAARDEFIVLMDDLDRLLGSHPSFLLGTWLESARRLGHNAAEKDLFEMNARDIITLWTGKECTIHEYASKEWSGLIRGFYKERWLRFFSQIEQCWEENRDFDAAVFDAQIADWEWEWVNSHDIYPSVTSGDCVELSVEIYDSYRQKIKTLYNESN